MGKLLLKIETENERQDYKNALHFIAQYTFQSIWQKLSFFIPTSKTRLLN